jgi:hypothetical protein
VGLAHATSIFPFAVHDRQDYLVSMDGMAGNAGSAELLRAYVDDSVLGSSAIKGVGEKYAEGA